MLDNNIKMMTFLDELREKLSSMEHEQWAHWVRFMLRTIYWNGKDGSKVPNTTLLKSRWERQVNTKYDDLTENEKNSDREWADKIIELLEPQVKQLEILLNDTTDVLDRVHRLYEYLIAKDGSRWFFDNPDEQLLAEALKRDYEKDYEKIHGISLKEAVEKEFEEVKRLSEMIGG